VKTKLVAVALLSLASWPLNAGRAPRHTAAWVIAANPSSTERVVRDKDGYFPIGTLVPAKLYRLSRDVILPTKNIVIIPAGTLMIPLHDDGRSVCELSSRRGSNFSCLTDSDNDGALDTYFGTQVFNEIFLGSIGDDGGFERLPYPIELASLNPKMETPQILIELKMRGTKADAIRFDVCTNTSWKSKYYQEHSCTKVTQTAPLNSSGQAMILGNQVQIDGLSAKPSYLTVDHNKADVAFSTTWTFP
jgi:hypothetical protein